MVKATTTKSTRAKTTVKAPSKSTTTQKTTVKAAVSPVTPAVAKPVTVKPAASTPVVSLIDAKPAGSGSSSNAPEDMLRKKELVDRIVTASGMKKKDVKPVVEAMLVELGAALSKGEFLNLHPFGKIKVTRQKDLDDGELLIARIRRNNRTTQGASPLADSDDDA